MTVPLFIQSSSEETPKGPPPPLPHWFYTYLREGETEGGGGPISANMKRASLKASRGYDVGFNENHVDVIAGNRSVTFITYTCYVQIFYV
jgi:hypothetical protein